MAKGKLIRLSEEDLMKARETLITAFFYDSAEQTQRKRFAELLPTIYVLRRKQNDFKEITALLNLCGFKLQLSSTRAYYSQMLPSRERECEDFWQQCRGFIEEALPQTKSLEIDCIPEAIENILSRKGKAKEIASADPL